ncbi:MAG: protein serine phosphatase with GAF(s) sensor(s) [Ilumatobacteraceae bacterium]|nr:protein serine phosphatase with GAF(s) sensor(s) [Ilumatobacteraceae bacterium]
MSERRSSIRLLPERSASRAARRFVENALGSAGMLSEDAMLFTSELVANAVTYAASDIDVVIVLHDDTLRVEVHDGFSISDAFQILLDTERKMADVDMTDTCGRGLILVRGTALGFGVIDKGEHGKAVWFEVPVEAVSTPAARSQRTANESPAPSRSAAQRLANALSLEGLRRGPFVLRAS